MPNSSLSSPKKPVYGRKKEKVYILNGVFLEYNLRGDFMADLLVVKAKLKDACPGYNVAGDLAEAADALVRDALKKACKRAEGNGRKTVMAKDL